MDRLVLKENAYLVNKLRFWAKYSLFIISEHTSEPYNPPINFHNRAKKKTARKKPPLNVMEMVSIFLMRCSNLTTKKACRSQEKGQIISIVIASQKQGVFLFAEKEINSTMKDRMC